MSVSDLHPILCLIFAAAAAFIAWVAFEAVPLFWRVDRWQPRRTVLACRVIAVLAAVAGGFFTAAAFAWTVAGLAPPVSAVYGWLVL